MNKNYKIGMCYAVVAVLPQNRKEYKKRETPFRSSDALFIQPALITKTIPLYRILLYHQIFEGAGGFQAAIESTHPSVPSLPVCFSF